MGHDRVVEIDFERVVSADDVRVTVSNSRQQLTGRALGCDAA